MTDTAPDPTATALTTIVDPQAKTPCRILGTDQHGREHRYWPHSGQITIHEHDGRTSETVYTFDLAGTTILEYRHLVANYVKEVDVAWNDEAFPS